MERPPFGASVHKKHERKSEVLDCISNASFFYPKRRLDERRLL